MPIFSGFYIYIRILSEMFSNLLSDWGLRSVAFSELGKEAEGTTWVHHFYSFWGTMRVVKAVRQADWRRREAEGW